MTSQEPIARPAFCRWCQSAIWRQVIPWVIEADTEPIRSVAEELAFRLAGRLTHQSHKIFGGFELLTRATWNLDGDYQNKVVLPDHRCTDIPASTHPDYWPKKGANHALPDF